MKVDEKTLFGIGFIVMVIAVTLVVVVLWMAVSWVVGVVALAIALFAFGTLLTLAAVN